MMQRWNRMCVRLLVRWLKREVIRKDSTLLRAWLARREANITSRLTRMVSRISWTNGWGKQRKQEEQAPVPTRAGTDGLQGQQGSWKMPTRQLNNWSSKSPMDRTGTRSRSTGIWRTLLQNSKRREQESGRSGEDATPVNNIRRPSRRGAGRRGSCSNGRGRKGVGGPA